MTTIEMGWGTKVSKEFREKVVRICSRLGWDVNIAPSYLMACMAFETGRTFSASIKNAAGSGAVGLIQFMPKTAIGLGTTSEKLAAMSALKQLDYVERYFDTYADKIETLCDMYMAILMPKYIVGSDDMVVFDSIKAPIAYNQNKGLDYGKKGYITKGDICYRIHKYYVEGLQSNNSLDIVLTAV